MLQSELKQEYLVHKCLAVKYDFCMPLDFLDIKYFKKMKIKFLDNICSCNLTLMALKGKPKVSLKILNAS